MQKVHHLWGMAKSRWTDLVQSRHPVSRQGSRAQQGSILRRARPQCPSQARSPARRPETQRSLKPPDVRHGHGNVKVITNCFQRVSCKAPPPVSGVGLGFYLDRLYPVSLYLCNKGSEWACLLDKGLSMDLSKAIRRLQVTPDRSTPHNKSVVAPTWGEAQGSQSYTRFRIHAHAPPH